LGLVSVGLTKKSPPARGIPIARLLPHAGSPPPASPSPAAASVPIAHRRTSSQSPTRPPARGIPSPTTPPHSSSAGRRQHQLPRSSSSERRGRVVAIFIQGGELARDGGGSVSVGIGRNPSPSRPTLAPPPSTRAVGPQPPYTCAAALHSRCRPPAATDPRHRPLARAAASNSPPIEPPQPRPHFAASPVGIPHQGRRLEPYQDGWIRLRLLGFAGIALVVARLRCPGRPRPQHASTGGGGVPGSWTVQSLPPERRR
jgi:antitoxin (DNA-binding transcriptional repressor) of toxin-antitoxin stability system